MKLKKDWTISKDQYAGYSIEEERGKRLVSSTVRIYTFRSNRNFENKIEIFDISESAAWKQLAEVLKQSDQTVQSSKVI